MEAFKVWGANPRPAGVEISDWNRAINEQIAKAKELPDTQRRLATIKDSQEVDKISAIGKDMPRFGQEKTTRIYIGTDPRKATDVYIALLDELEANGAMKDINASLNMEVLREGKLTGNMIIIYDPMSRPQVLERILEAYRNAKQTHPDLFFLTPRQRAAVMRWDLRLFHATVDANMSFVEQPAYRHGGTFDEDDRVRIQKAFGIGTEDYSDQEWFEKTQKYDTKGVVWSSADEKKIHNGQVNTGDVFHFERKLSAPALVQEGTIVAK